MSPVDFQIDFLKLFFFYVHTVIISLTIHENHCKVMDMINGGKKGGRGGNATRQCSLSLFLKF